MYGELRFCFFFLQLHHVIWASTLLWQMWHRLWLGKRRKLQIVSGKALWRNKCNVCALVPTYNNYVRFVFECFWDMLHTKAEEGLPTLTSDFGLLSSDFWVPTSDFWVLTSEFRLATCDLRLATCDLRLATCDWRLPTCDFWLQNLNDRTPTCDLFPWKSGQILIFVLLCFGKLMLSCIVLAM